MQKRDVQIQINLDAILGKHTKDLASQAVQYLASELPVKEYDIAKSFETLTVWLVAEMIKHPHPFFQIQVQWGLTENENQRILIGQKNQSLGWRHFTMNFSKGTEYPRVTKAMIEQSHLTIKDFRRYGFVS